MNEDLEYIQFFLRPTDKEAYVYYITNFQESNKKRLVLPLKRFKNFLLENFDFTNEEKEKVFNYLHEHKLVYVNKRTREINAKDIFENYEKADFKTLWELNKMEEKKEPFQIVKETLNEFIFGKNQIGTRAFIKYRSKRKF